MEGQNEENTGSEMGSILCREEMKVLLSLYKISFILLEEGKLYVAQMRSIVSDRKEKVVGKKRISLFSIDTSFLFNMVEKILRERENVGY